MSKGQIILIIIGTYFAIATLIDHAKDDDGEFVQETIISLVLIVAGVLL